MNIKTSNKLILAALFLLLVSLTGYDYLLRAEYISGRYRDPYSTFITLKFTNFDAVDVNSTSAVNVKFVQGPFSVRVDTGALEFAKFKQQGNRLKIYATFKGDYIQNGNPYIVVISCPKLTEVNTNAIFIAGNKQVTDTVYREDWHMRQNLIEGFTEDSLSIRQSFGSNIILSGNHIRVFNAVVGINTWSFAETFILKNNQFQQANVDVLNRSHLLVEGQTIHDLKYHLADSAKITFTGSAQDILNKSKSQQK